MKINDEMLKEIRPLMLEPIIFEMWLHDIDIEDNDTLVKEYCKRDPDVKSFVLNVLKSNGVEL